MSIIKNIVSVECKMTKEWRKTHANRMWVAAMICLCVGATHESLPMLICGSLATLIGMIIDPV